MVELTKRQKQIERNLRKYGALQAQTDARIARWIEEARRTELHKARGFATLREYLERWLGYGPRAAEDRQRVAEALRELPYVAKALKAGRLNYSKVRELIRVVVPKTAPAWVKAVENVSVRQVEQLVKGRKRGDLPDSPQDPDLMMRAIHGKVSPATYALFLEARERAQADTGERLSDDALFAMLLRTYLAAQDAAANDNGSSSRAPYRIQITQCADCHRAKIGDQDLSPEELEQARCDCTIIDDTVTPAKRTRDIPEQTRRIVKAWFGGRCAVPGCRNRAHVEIHHIEPRASGGSHDKHNLVCLCWAHHSAHHHGRLKIHGRSPEQLIFEHADGTPYGATPTWVVTAAVKTRRPARRAAPAGRADTPRPRRTAST